MNISGTPKSPSGQQSQEQKRPLFCPVTFSLTPPVMPNTLLSESNEGDIVPVFCKTALPDAGTKGLVNSTSTRSDLTTFVPFNSQIISSALQQPSPHLSSTLPVQPPLSGTVINEKAPVPKIKAYDIAQSLIAQLPMKMVGNALYVFEGRAYHLVDVNQMHRLIMEYCRWAVQAIGNTTIIRQIYEVLHAEYRLVVNTPPSKRFVTFSNCLLDLDTGLTQPHTPDIFVTARIEGNYVPELANCCPRFQNFLTSISGGDRLLEQRILEMLGYALTPDTDGKCFFLLQGVPNSGKSVLGELLSSIFPEGSVTSLDLNALGLQFGPGELVDKRLCLSMDLPAAPWDSKAVGALKSFTGNDLVTADIKYQPRIKFRNTATFLFGTNHPVILNSPDEALLNRLIAVPFKFAVPNEHQDYELLKHLLTERDAIISTAIRAYQGLRQRRYQFCGNYRLNEVIAPCTGESVMSLDQAIADFVSQRCIRDPDTVTFLDDLHAAFCDMFPVQVDPQTFSVRLKALLTTSFSGQVNKIRKRKPGVRNPTSAFADIRLK